MPAHLDTGRRGEDLAMAHLLGLGLRLVHRNWRHGARHELDLVLHDPRRSAPQGELVIVEVKTLSGEGAREPWEAAFTPQKRRALRAAAEAYCALEAVALPVRFDVVAVTIDPARLEHYEDVRMD